jgi:hypothetical protein
MVNGEPLEPFAALKALFPFTIHHSRSSSERIR